MNRFFTSFLALILSVSVSLGQENPTFIMLGDSITKGVRPGVTAEQTFSSILAEKLGVTVENAGIGGERTDQALTRLDSSVIAKKPKFVGIMYGTNDSYIDQAKTENRITIEAYRENLIAIVEKLRAAKIEPVLMTAPRWAAAAAVKGIGKNPNRALAAYIAVCREVATTKKVALIDHFEHWSKAMKDERDLRDWTTDGCHPNPQGHQEIARLMLPILQQMIATENVKPVVFTAMGCGPYSSEAADAMVKFIALENANPSSSFIIHLGDIVTGKRKDWPESQYEKVAKMLSNGNKIPTFIIPGDNEWNDQANPDLAWSYWEKHFMGFDKKWKLPDDASPVERQTVRPENFAFVLEGVLFIGINKVGGRIHDKAEWETRLNQNAEWISAQFTKHKDDTHTAAILAHASPAAHMAHDLPVLIAKAAEAYGKQVLYLHADGHKWIFEPQKFGPFVTRVQLDVVNAQFPPVQVQITGKPGEPFTFDRRLDNPEWKVSLP